MMYETNIHTSYGVHVGGMSVLKGGLAIKRGNGHISQPINLHRKIIIMRMVVSKQLSERKHEQEDTP